MDLQVREALREALYVARLKQGELGALVGVKPATVSHWFTGHRKVPHLKAVAIEKITGGVVSRRRLAPDYPWDELES